MKKNVIFALCLVFSCTMLAGCGPANENISVDNTEITEAVSETVPETEAVTSEITTTVTTAVSTTAVTTAVTSETTAETTTQTSAEEKKDEQNNSQAEEKHEEQRNEEPENKEPEAQEQSSGSFTESDLSFTFNGCTVTLGEDLSSFTSSLTPDFEDTSECRAGGKDYLYGYGHFQINGFMADGTDVIRAVAIDIDNADVSTPKGIHIGSTRDDVIKAYGNADGNGNITYKLGKASLMFVMNSDNTVKLISYNYEV